MEGIKLTKEKLANSVPLIGFAGATWTIFCYIVEGRGSKNFDIAKQVAYSDPEMAHNLLQMITDVTIAYLKAKVAAGCDALQLFDSWAGVLPVLEYQTFAWQYTYQIVEALAPLVPVIVFAKGCHNHLRMMSDSSAAAFGIDWTASVKSAKTSVTTSANSAKVLQGNLDPAWLLTTPEVITKKVNMMLEFFGKDNYIANLGHGILPNTPVENAKAFVNAVKNSKWS